MTYRTLCTLLLFFSAPTIFAQKILREEHLAGNWTLAAFNMSGVYLDFAKDSIELSAGLKARIEREKMEEVKADIKKRLEQYKKGFLKIGPDKKYSQTLMGNTATGTFSLIVKDGKQYLRIVNDGDNPTIDQLLIWKDRGWLYLSYADANEGTVTLMFERPVSL